MDRDTDFASQKQNFTQLIHFNSGLGWEKVLKEPIKELQEILGDSSASDRKKAKAILLDKNKSKLAKQEGQEAFLKKVAEVMESYSSTSSTGDAELDSTDVEALHQAVDVLSFINQ